MNIVSILLVILVIVILLLVLAFYLIKMNKSKKDFIYIEDNKKNIFDMRLINIPHNIEVLTNNSLREISKEIYKFFEILDYRNNDEEYHKNSWHSWQVSFLVAMYKRDLELFYQIARMFLLKMY